MERFKYKNGVLLSPPRNAVASDGRVLSNFDLMIAHDKAFAEENGYYPKSEQPIVLPEQGYDMVYRLLKV